jgi:serine/threonine-protein kinase
MQNVYQAKDIYFKRPVALKVPKEDAAVKRFERSAVVSARVNHANIAKTLDYFVDEDNAYLVEEYVDGFDLSKLVPSQIPYLPPSTAARVLHQLAKGLAASHHAGVVHRDLKPSNIMVVGGLAFAEVKITDFGIAKMAEGEIGPWASGEDKGATSSKTILGAIPYMAPESLSDFKTADRPSDIWSIGAIVYELLGGARPFGSGPTSIQRILEGKTPKPPAEIGPPQFRGLGKELYDLIVRCLEPEPAKRINADDLVKACAQLCYSVDNYELGEISANQNSYVGFILADKGKSLMYHRDNFYGEATRAIGSRLWFGRHPGGNNDRAFPIVKMKTS